MRYLKINPFDRVVTEHTAPRINLELMHAVILCDTVTRLSLFEGGKVDCWLDDDGLVNDNPEQRFFTFRSSRRLLAGNALICGLDRQNGASIGLPVGVSHDEIAAMVEWIGPQEEAERLIQAGKLDRPETAIHTQGHREVLWQWAATPRGEETPAG